MQFNTSNISNNSSFLGFMKLLDEKFMPHVIDETSIEIREDIKNCRKLNKKDSHAVIRKLNLQLHQFLSSVKPDMSVWKCLADFLRSKMPDTFANENTTEDSNNPKKDLSRRICKDYFSVQGVTAR